MKGIKFLLDKYKIIQPPDISIKKLFIENVYTNTRIFLDKKNVTIKNKTIYVHISSVEKNEIKMNQKEILLQLNKDIGERNVINSIF